MKMVCLFFSACFLRMPHPEAHAKNSPRPSSAFKEIEEIMGAETEPGDSTFFGTSERHGAKTPRTRDEGAYFGTRILL
jgi:hypothetical protein